MDNQNTAVTTGYKKATGTGDLLPTRKPALGSSKMLYFLSTLLAFYNLSGSQIIALPSNFRRNNGINNLAVISTYRNLENEIREREFYYFISARGTSSENSIYTNTFYN